jgi:hypothetical protein
MQARETLLRESPSARRRQVQHINDVNTHPPNTGTSSTLMWINRDSLFPIRAWARGMDLRFTSQRSKTGNAFGAT